MSDVTRRQGIDHAGRTSEKERRYGYPSAGHWADAEDPDEYRAANIFWVPKEPGSGESFVLFDYAPEDIRLDRHY
jgi:hypothetical protein